MMRLPAFMRAMVFTLGLLTLPGWARADNIFGDFQRLPDEIEQGFSLGFDFGLLYLTGQSNLNTSAANPGFQLQFTSGYDILSYLSAEAIIGLGIHEANAADPILQGGVNSFFFDGAAKLQLPKGRFRPFAEIGGGIFYSRPEFVAGKSKALNLLFAGGFEYYTYLRHYSLYVKGTYNYIDLPIDALGVSAGLKYTF